MNKKFMLMLMFIFTLSLVSGELCTETNPPCVTGGCSETDLTNMYYGYDFNTDINNVGNISNFNTSCIINLQGTFANSNFNQDIRNWDTSNILSLRNTFYNNKEFNQNIKNWNTSKVVNMQGTFYNTTFNQDISNWDVSLVQNFFNTFYNNSFFNQNLSDWDTSDAVTFEGMFQNATNFNYSVGNWDISLASTDGLKNMFDGVTLPINIYDDVLSKWSIQAQNEGIYVINFNAGNSQYTNETAHDLLTNTYSWNITDGGLYVSEECNKNLTNWVTLESGSVICRISKNLTIEKNDYNINQKLITLENNGILNGNGSTLFLNNTFLPFRIQGSNTELKNINLDGLNNSVGIIYGFSGTENLTINNMTCKNPTYNSDPANAYYSSCLYTLTDNLKLYNSNIEASIFNFQGHNNKYINISCYNKKGSFVGLNSVNNTLNNIHWNCSGLGEDNPDNITLRYYSSSLLEKTNLLINNSFFNGNINDSIILTENISNVEIINTELKNDLYIYGKDVFLNNISLENNLLHIMNKGSNIDLKQYFYDNNIFLNNLGIMSEKINDNINFGYNWVSIEDGEFTINPFNTKGNIKFKVNNENYVPLKDGEECLNECSNILNDGEYLSFNVSGFSNYSYGLTETNTTTTTGDINISIDEDTKSFFISVLLIIISLLLLFSMFQSFFDGKEKTPSQYYANSVLMIFGLVFYLLSGFLVEVQTPFILISVIIIVINIYNGLTTKKE